MLPGWSGTCGDRGAGILGDIAVSILRCAQDRLAQDLQAERLLAREAPRHRVGDGGKMDMSRCLLSLEVDHR